MKVWLIEDGSDHALVIATTSHNAKMVAIEEMAISGDATITEVDLDNLYYESLIVFGQKL